MTKPGLPRGFGHNSFREKDADGRDSVTKPGLPQGFGHIGPQRSSKKLKDAQRSSKKLTKRQEKGYKTTSNTIKMITQGRTFAKCKDAHKGLICMYHVSTQRLDLYVSC